MDQRGLRAATWGTYAVSLTLVSSSYWVRNWDSHRRDLSSFSDMERSGGAGLTGQPCVAHICISYCWLTAPQNSVVSHDTISQFHGSGIWPQPSRVPCSESLKSYSGRVGQDCRDLPGEDCFQAHLRACWQD